MHGRKRSEYKALQRDSKVVAKLSAKATAWHQLQAALLHRQRQLQSELQKQQQQEQEGIVVNTTTAADSSSISLEIIENTLQLVEKAVTVNPDPIWLWNFRQDLLLQHWKAKKNATTSESAAAATTTTTTTWNQEQALTQAALMNNPKAYAAWHHRKRALQEYLLRNNATTTNLPQQQQEENDTVLQQELGLTALFLQKDERNFHCWSYRRFIVSCQLWNINGMSTTLPPTGDWHLDHDDETVPQSLSGTTAAATPVLWMGAQLTTTTTSTNIPDPPAALSLSTNAKEVNEKYRALIQQEWDFANVKIRDNFSNFSAFHYKSKLLPLLLLHPQQNDNDNNDTLQTIMTQEFALVSNAIFTEPDDQTAWWYQAFLCHFMSVVETVANDTNTNNNYATWYQTDILQPHIQQLRELCEETNYKSKWVLLGLYQCLQYVANDDNGDTNTTGGGNWEERQSILESLIQVDPDRQGRYNYLIQKLRQEKEQQI